MAVLDAGAAERKSFVRLTAPFIADRIRHKSQPVDSLTETARLQDLLLLKSKGDREMKRFFITLLLMVALLVAISIALADGQTNPYWKESRDIPEYEITDTPRSRDSSSLSVVLDVPDELSTGVQTTLYANASGGTPPYSYSFAVLQIADEQPEPGVLWLQYQYMQQTFTDSNTLDWVFYVPSTGYRLRVWVQDSTGTMVSTTKTVNVGGMDYLANKINLCYNISVCDFIFKKSLFSPFEYRRL